MNYEFIDVGNAYMRSLHVIRSIQFVLYGMFLMFVFYSCSSSPTTLPAKLDLSEERQLVEDMKNLEPEQKTVILKAFDKADSYSESIRVYARELETQNAKLKKEVAENKEDASAYRLWRNWIIGISLAIVLGTILWQLRDWILPILRRLVGIPL